MRKIPKNLNLYLCYNNYELQGVVAEGKLVDCSVNIGEFEELTIVVPQYIDSAIDIGKKEENRGYKLIKEEKLIYIKDCGYFIIKEKTIDVNENGEKEATIKCYGQEYRLSKKNIVMETKTIQLKSNAVDPTAGIFDMMEQETGWKLVMVDEVAQYDFIMGGKTLKYRYFDGIQKTWWGFLTEEVQTAYDVVLYFDNLKKEVYCYGRSSFGELTRLYISKSNYLESLQTSSNAQDIITRLYATGSEGLTFNSVNPLGTQYVEDFSYFRNADYMSQSLLTALDKYYPRLEVINEEWKRATSELLGMQNERAEMANTLQIYNEELKVLKALQTSYAKEGDDDNLTRIKTEIQAQESKISSQSTTINNKDEQIKKKQEDIQKICDSSSKQNIKDSNNNLIFTKSTLEELDNFIYEGNWSNESCITEEGLYASALQQLSVVSKPQVEITVSLKDLEFNDFKEKIKTDGNIETVEKYFIEECGLGHFVQIEGVDYADKIRIVGYTYSPSDDDMTTGSISLNLSTSEFALTYNGTLGSVINNSTKVSRVFNANKMSLEKARENANWIEEYYQNALDVKMKNILASQGRNKIMINENGVWCEDGNNSNDIVLMTSGGLLISDDGLTTCRTAIDAQGVVAEEIVGRLLIGEKLYISDTNGEMELLGNLLTIKDNSLKTRVKLGEYDKLKKKYGLQLFDKNGEETVLDEDGIVQRERIMETDNLDKDFPMRMFIPIDEGIREVRTADLYLFPQKFRGYTKGNVADQGTVESSGASSSFSSGSAGAISIYEGTSYGGEVTKEFTSAPTSWNPTAGGLTTPPMGDNYDEHFHAFSIADEIYHTHKVQIDIPSHSHNFGVYQQAHFHDISHTHQVIIPTHNHETIYGIFEYQKAPTLQLFINGEQIGGDINTDSIINVRPYLKLNSNNYIEIRATGLARCTASLVLKTMASY